MITLYINGCSTCGYVAHLVRAIEKKRPDVVIRNSRYDAPARAEHATYIQQLGMKDNYAPLVVENGHPTRLQEWVSSN